MKTVLTIAGSDCSGGAGIQADIKTITVHGLFATSVITALTAQNTTGVFGVLDTEPSFVAKQIDCVFEDIRPDAVKVGMVSNAEIIEVIAEKFKFYKAENIVVDPVMVSTSGSKLLSENAINTLINKLLPMATIITPNIPEAETLCGFKIQTEDEMIKSAKKISTFLKGGILIKGGHFEGNSNDLFYQNDEVTWFKSDRIDNPNTHGTGCTLSSAIASNLAMGKSMVESIQNAKNYITLALKANLNLGKGSGPLKHMINKECIIYNT